LEIVQNQVKVPLKATEIYFMYVLRSPVGINYPSEILEKNGEIHAKFAQGEIIDHLQKDGENLIVNREWDLDYKGQLNLAFNVKCNLTPSFYIIPSVVVNGNKFGKGNYPQPKLSEKYSFREDRCAIPSCGIIEDSKNCLGIFTDPATNETFMSSISLYCKDQNMNLEICTPWEEQPVRYVSKFRVLKGLTNYLDLNGSFKYNRKFYLCNSKVEANSKGYYEVLRYAWEKLSVKPKIPKDWSDWMRRKIQFAVNVFYARVGNAHGFVTSLWNPMLPFSPTFSGGFLGKNIEIAYCLYRMYLLNEMEKLKEIAFNVTNFLTSRPLPNGLFFSDYNPALHKWYGYRLGMQMKLNTRMMGEIGYFLLRFYSLTHDQSEANQRWFRFVENFCDFMVVHQSPSASFGKWWSQKGELLEDTGTNGAYVIWTLGELYKMTKDEKYRTAALKAGQFYKKTFVETEEYWGDTLDANAIDKEAGHAILRAMIILYEISGDKTYLEAACRTAHYICTWQIIYNTCFPKNSKLAQRNFNTFGGTIVSVENMHTDPYIVFTVDFLRLWKYTGDIYWKNRAIAGLEFALQMVASERDTLGYKEWFVGWQPEQYNHTTWAYYDLNTIFPNRINPKGKFTGSVAWVLAATMGTVFDIAEEFPDLIEIHSQPIKLYSTLGYRFSKLLRDLIIRIHPM
jgi:hypothetical protein